jgi:hypothetical protein
VSFVCARPRACDVCTQRETFPSELEVTLHLDDCPYFEGYDSYDSYDEYDAPYPEDGYGSMD